MDDKMMKSILEGLIFLSGEEGIRPKTVASILQTTEKKILQNLQQLRQEYDFLNRGIRMVEIAGSYKLTTVPEHAPYFQKLATSKEKSTLSQAALETLAIIAYRQPLTRVSIEQIRGVKVDRVLHQLENKSLIEEKGREKTMGRPILYGTTQAFLEYFGLANLQHLPELENLEPISLEPSLLFD